jgi:hypothetical protein
VRARARVGVSPDHFILACSPLLSLLLRYTLYEPEPVQSVILRPRHILFMPTYLPNAVIMNLNAGVCDSTSQAEMRDLTTMFVSLPNIDLSDNIECQSAIVAIQEATYQVSGRERESERESERARAKRGQKTSVCTKRACGAGWTSRSKDAVSIGADALRFRSLRSNSRARAKRGQKTSVCTKRACGAGWTSRSKYAVSIGADALRFRSLRSHSLPRLRFTHAARSDALS